MKCILIAIVMSLVHVGEAVNQTVPWFTNSTRGQYADLTFQPGDTITFNWTSGFHDVHQHVFNNCTTTGSILLAPATSTVGTKYEYKFTTTGDFYFACQVGTGTHCSVGGMLLKAHVCTFWETLWAWIKALFTFFIIRSKCL